MISLLKEIKPYRLYVVVVLALMLLQSMSQLYLPTLMSDIVDKGVFLGDTPYIWRLGGIMLLVAAGGTLCMITASFLLAKTATGFGRLLRAKLFAHVARFSLAEFDKFGTASLITRTTNDITQVQQLVVMMRMFIASPTMMIGAIVLAVSKEPGLSLVLICSIPVLGATIWLVARQGIPLFRVMQKKLDRLNLVLRERLTGIRVIRAFDREAYESERFREANVDLTGTAIRVNRIMSMLMPLMIFLMNVTTIAIMWFGGLRIDEGTMQVGDLMAFIQYAAQVMFSLMMLSMMFVMIPRASASAVRINEVLHTEPSIQNADQAVPSSPERASIEFRNVTFRYPGAEQAALEEVSFTARPGEITAIIGGTGSGKSTLMNVLLRFYDLNEGRILLGGIDIRDMELESLRRSIGFVPQKALLFTGTVADNIRFGRQEASDKDVSLAAETSQAAEFVAELKGGLDAVLAQGGSNLSGGQKQRLSIARALARRPAVYLFDDSFSALDYKTDARLRAALKSEVTEATVLIVAQRVSTIMDADRIVVLEDGRVAGVGRHRELLGTCEVYREIVDSQQAGEESA